ncbi:hypothetical protein [Burkholderia stagnalis]|uniref:hypothetical protein n=1 Tax=Burkholderia stagnalis TaxID=1503054 RepID=UPI00075F70C4|nr:hypothetical protein [Burkholderia stagnalis]KVO57012.1 hypothetical protein WT18_19175 [Burkholderia stagnalis]KVP11295.1 hypothetical protein WT20_14600 [Burkholderia stagnalis]KWN66886.1 hypothetical protein WT90_31310 [Burkholderia stagnalis]
MNDMLQDGLKENLNTGAEANRKETGAFLKEEYFQLQKAVEDFDQRALTIKAWSITSSMAAIATAMASKSGGVCLLAAIGSLSFWMTEALWKTFQQCYYTRVRTIEGLFRESIDPSAAPFQINSEFHASFLRIKFDFGHFLYIMFWPHVMLPHVIVTMAGIISWWLLKK